MTSARHTTKQIEKLDQGILTVLEGERWLNTKGIRRKLTELRIYPSGQFVSQRCNILEEQGKIEKLDYNRNHTGGRQCWRLV